jgi:hypothetical protein
MRQSNQSKADAGTRAAPVIPLRAFARPSVLVEAALSLSPLVGIAYAGWDMYLVVMLHLFALAIAAAFLVLRMLTLSDEAMRYFDTLPRGKGRARGIRWVYGVFAALVFALPLLLFVAIISEEFGGTWVKDVRGPGDFWRSVVVASGLWMPLAFVAAWEAASYVVDVVLPRFGWRLFAAPAVGETWAHLSDELKVFLHYRAFVVLRMIVTVLAIGVALVFAVHIGVTVLVVVLFLLKTVVAVFLEAGAVVDAERKSAP